MKPRPARAGTAPRQVVQTAPGGGWKLAGSWLAGMTLIHVAFAASIGLHALLLTVNFVVPALSRDAKDKTLEIVLVNSKSAQRPREAQVHAQANLDGGGNVDEKRRAKTPLPASASTRTGDHLEEMQQRVRELEARQRELIVQARRPSPAAASRRSREEALETSLSTPSGRDLASNALAMARLQAEIDRDYDDYSKRPVKKFIGAQAEEMAGAMYLEAWRQKIERVGTLNYPQAARGKIYGSLTVWVELRPDGSLYHTEIRRSSGHKVLDEAALKILRMAAPFGQVPSAMLGGAEVVGFARIWSFTRDSALESRGAQ